MTEGSTKTDKYTGIYGTFTTTEDLTKEYSLVRRLEVRVYRLRMN